MSEGRGSKLVLPILRMEDLKKLFGGGNRRDRWKRVGQIFQGEFLEIANMYFTS